MQCTSLLILPLVLPPLAKRNISLLGKVITVHDCSLILVSFCRDVRSERDPKFILEFPRPKDCSHGVTFLSLCATLDFEVKQSEVDSQVILTFSILLKKFVVLYLMVSNNFYLCL